MIYPNQSLEKKLFQSGVKTIVALDEVGRGALAGPIVATAVAIDWQQLQAFKKFTNFKIRESKLLTENLREKLFKNLADSLNWSLGLASHSEIDQLGIGPANILVLKRALDNLRADYDYLLLDYVHGFSHPKPFQTIIDGDYKIFSIAIASILAKVSRDRMMKEYHLQYPDYSFDRHKGYGTKLHQRCLRRFGPCSIHRRSFNLNFNY